VSRPAAEIRDAIAQALRALADGVMTIPVHSVVPLAEAGTALDALAARQAQGKILLDLR
jgi:NADPH:quinone reductase-like Zn-dependent oxidoreductase